MKEQINAILAGGIKKEFPATDQALPQAITFAEEFLESAGCSMKTQMAITVALEEVFVNIAHYAYGKDEGQMGLEIAEGALPEGRAAVIRTSDKGLPFDPLAHQDPDVSMSAEQRKIGGLGIFMVKKMMDGVSYAYVNGENQLTFFKYF